jgi:hypothetical protein
VIKPTLPRALAAKQSPRLSDRGLSVQASETSGEKEIIADNHARKVRRRSYLRGFGEFRSELKSRIALVNAQLGNFDRRLIVSQWTSFTFKAGEDGNGKLRGHALHGFLR